MVVMVLGAGNIEEFTNGFLKFFDLTIPLSLPRKDWVFSLEVGEHIPHQFEGMVLRNFHAHNCKGIVMSW
jgi:tryptophanyl-tRNA synthetase